MTDVWMNQTKGRYDTKQQNPDTLYSKDSSTKPDAGATREGMAEERRMTRKTTCRNAERVVGEKDGVVSMLRLLHFDFLRLPIRWE